jgi:4-methyl-5(b-hydroxyethyl)-thiazole monophosphate biosynthesis
MKRVAVLFADGFEEIEAITPVDLLRRAGVETLSAGIGKKVVTGAHGIVITADVSIDELKGGFDGVVIPGGMPGAENIARAGAASALIAQIWKAGGLVAAICAAPAVVLGPLGIVSGKKAVCYPGFEDRRIGAIHNDEPVGRDGPLITGQGPGTAFAFTLCIIEYLVGAQTAEKIRIGTRHLK